MGARVCVRVCAYLCVCVRESRRVMHDFHNLHPTDDLMCVCVCERERERERECVCVWEIARIYARVCVRVYACV